MPHPRSFYLKLGAACFVLGGCMELFMINTGFYNIVTQTEAERWEQTREEREERARQFRASVVEQYRRRGLEPPAALRSDRPDA
ncbi:hypothetical protein Rsub_08997 [Raphidocelis subcapitata]|uniref:Uncharacterized protein n=1 Tax=Raphidocelis subcapitata TaxID=307507 RepID=A0A2V0PI15_9CHLO|nr:hypothetical protein Rsub_08997 [Raphidocelis subcapitata]|eukprot:GBF96917.1 hypothetical protein Rsub_08997 [Raphidocelis subcapitata]